MIKYSKAYRIGDLRIYEHWDKLSEKSTSEPVEDDEFVFLLQDYRVVGDFANQEESQLLRSPDVSWIRFCTEKLEFSEPQWVEQLGGPV